MPSKETPQALREKGEQITEADYQVWRHHPVTKVLYRYLRDYQAALQDKALAHLLEDSDSSHTLDPKYVGEIAGRIKAVREIPELPFEAILNFYQKDEVNDTETSTSEHLQDGNRSVYESGMDGY